MKATPNKKGEATMNKVKEPKASNVELLEVASTKVIHKRERKIF